MSTPTFGFQKPYPSKFEPWFMPNDFSGGFPDGRNWRLLEPLEFLRKDGTHIRATAGTVTDGVSTPRGIWNLIAPFDYWLCGVLHDALYHASTEIWDATLQVWAPYVVQNHDDADSILDEALESRGCSTIERKTIVDALRAFGESAFHDDRVGPILPTPTKC